jgi:transposase
LEPHFPQLHLAQADSNRALQGRKHDFADAQRLTRRLLSGELILSFVPNPEPRDWRTITRAKVQLVRDRVRLENQREALLEETRSKLSSVISELLGFRGRRILEALAAGASDPVELAKLGDRRLRCSREQLADALRGQGQPLHRQMLKLFLERLDLLDRQSQQLDQMAAAAMRPYEDAVIRLAGVPRFGPDSAQQTIAEVGAYARSFDSSAQFASWAGVCPGRQEGADTIIAPVLRKEISSCAASLLRPPRLRSKRRAPIFRPCFADGSPSSATLPPSGPSPTSWPAWFGRFYTTRSTTSNGARNPILPSNAVALTR